MPRRFLVPLDSSGTDESILAEARRVLPPDGEIHLLHVVPSFAPPVGMAPTHRLELEERAAAYLDGVRSRMSQVKGVNLVRAGDPADGILQVSLELNIDLIAMSTHARKGAARWVLGSVAESVVRKSWLPVLLARPGAPPPSRDLRRILVPVDQLGSSEKILKTVKPIALRTDAEVVLLHVRTPVPDPAPLWAIPAPSHVSATQTRRLDALTDELEEGGVSAWALFKTGDPMEEIVRQVDALRPDWVAMTTHCRAGLEKAVVGSVAEGVLQRVSCPVLLSRPL